MDNKIKETIVNNIDQAKRKPVWLRSQTLYGVIGTITSILVGTGVFGNNENIWMTVISIIVFSVALISGETIRDFKIFKNASEILEMAAKDENTKTSDSDNSINSQ